MSLVRPAAVLAVLGCVALTSCTSGPPAPAPTPTSVAPTAVATPAPPTDTADPEPTTTNTLPPPPAPTAPAPSTAGALSARSLPVPDGWRKAALPGGDEEGFKGNGTWVHARDPRYAAQDAITIGCAGVTRDDYTDPKSALEGNYTGPAAAPGVGLILDFGDSGPATEYFALYQRQVQACTTQDEPRTRIIGQDGGLVDQRTYADSEWTEVAKQTGNTVTLIILSDPGHRISRAAATKILGQIGG